MQIKLNQRNEARIVKIAKRYSTTPTLMANFFLGISLDEQKLKEKQFNNLKFPTEMFLTAKKRKVEIKP